MTQSDHVQPSQPEPQARTVEFKPYVLWRRGMLSVDSLRFPTFEATWNHLENSEKHRVEREHLADRLADVLYDLVPQLERRDRRKALRLRRDVYNDRSPSETAFETVGQHLSGDQTTLLERWRALKEQGKEAARAAEQSLEAGWRQARVRLADIATDENFLKGVQISGEHLYKYIRRFIDKVRRSGGKLSSRRLRQTESTILRFAYRMALRTSPFGSFTEIGAQPWSSDSTGEGSWTRRHSVRLNRGLLSWMTFELRNIQGAEQVLCLRLNDTIARSGDRIEAFSRGSDGSEHSYWGERFLDARVVPGLSLVLEILAAGPRPKREVVDALRDRGVQEEGALTFLDRLVDAGICHLDLGLADQIAAYPAAVADKLEEVDAEQADACRDIFRALERIENKFGEASVAERDGLLEEIETEIQRFADLCELPPPPDVARSHVFEDLSADRPAKTWDADLLERNRSGFFLLQKVLPIIDDTSIEKLGLYRWFASHYGEAGRCDDLLATYRRFAEQSSGEVSAVMRAVGDSAAEQIGTLQRRLLKELDEAISGADEELELDEEWFERFTSSRPPFLLPLQEASYRVQLAPTPTSDGENRIILNDVTSGFGIFFSRFCGLVEPADEASWSLRRSLQQSISETHPPQADITAVFGLNVNLHPRLTPLEVVYPGSIPASRGGDVLFPRDLALKADPISRRVRVVHGREGYPIELTPMNFVFPAATPMFYRFLCLLAPVHVRPMSLWERLRRVGPRTYSHQPRLLLGDLVLERRRWYVAVEELVELVGDQGLESSSDLKTIEEWRLDRRLPRECFFRLQRYSGSVEEHGWAEATRRWALDARRARRKGQYLDFRNPLLVDLLLQEISSDDPGVVEFQECLPATTLYEDEQGPASAEEFVVEARLREALS